MYLLDVVDFVKDDVQPLPHIARLRQKRIPSLTNKGKPKTRLKAVDESVQVVVRNSLIIRRVVSAGLPPSCRKNL